MTELRGIWGSGPLRFAAVAAAAAATAAAGAAVGPAAAAGGPVVSVARDLDGAGKSARFYGGQMGAPSPYPVLDAGVPEGWGEGVLPEEGLQGVQQMPVEDEGAAAADRDHEIVDRGVGSNLSSSRRHTVSASKEPLLGYADRHWGPLEGPQPHQKSTRRWGEVGVQGGDASREAWNRALRSAGSSIRELSRRMHQRSEEYWKEPRLRKGLIYLAAVIGVIIGIAYSEHRMRVYAAEGKQLREREALLLDIQRDITVETEAAKKGLEEAQAIKERQECTAKELEEAEEALKTRREQLRARSAGLQEEHLLLSIRRAQAQMAGLTAMEAPTLDDDREQALQKLQQMKEEANSLFWMDDESRKTAGAALSDMALLETDVRSRYNTLLRVMTIDVLTPPMRQQALQLKQELRNCVADFESKVHSAIAIFSDKLWGLKAERKLVTDPSLKSALRKGLLTEWEAQEEHQHRVLGLREAGREALEASRTKIRTIMEALEEPMPEEERLQAQGYLFGLMSAELYQESFLRVLDADVARHLDRASWLAKMEGLLEVADKRASAARNSWKTERAVLAEVKGKIKAVKIIMAALDDKMDLCATVHKTWSEKWGRIEGTG
ncbi:hypothetical protein, conserved [Eimeria acervulina]|uniref:Uncharacterized protein n=1 Tax=Eimeria acervulina TaxID=5801 RepID=U6GT29_EIMAC|nr:hypothetical protein, conserved [Eimeria acervulina]CDI81739.1 hypothetical protein, conserved [Eimeria acervulina]